MKKFLSSLILLFCANTIFSEPTNICLLEGLDIVPALYQALFIKNSQETKIPIFRAARLVWAESGFDPHAKNINWSKDRKRILSVDAGLFMLNSIWLVEFERYNDGKKVNPHDIETNIRVGFRKLAALLKKNKGNWTRTIIDWNGAGLLKVLQYSTTRLIAAVIEGKNLEVYGLD